tara:strand:- start:14556 stop:15674 length:1119 start_codon:yes stop_codon:yes gene_type:complete
MIPLFKVNMPKSVIKPVTKTLLSGFIGQGPKVEEFERKLKSWFGNDNCLTLNSGTSALHLAYYLSYKYRKKKLNGTPEVISTPMTCMATNTPIQREGFKIVWCDVDPLTGLADPEDIKRKITKNTIAITCVHWAGNVCDLNNLNNIAKKNNIYLIEDCSHGFGSKWKDKKLGNKTADFSIFSLQAIKHLTTVDGGILFTKSKKFYKDAKLLRWYGINRDNKKRVIARCEEMVYDAGWKFHMNDVSATIGIEQLKNANQIIQKHILNAKYYENNISNSRKIKKIPQTSNSLSSNWIYTLHAKNRNKFEKYMKDNGVFVNKVHIRNDIHPCFKKFRNNNLVNLDNFDKSYISIPVGWWLTKKNLTRVVELINNY